MQNQNWATTAPDQQNAQRTFLTRPPPPQPNQPQAPLVQPQQVQQPPPEQPRYPNVPTTDAYKPFSKDAVETLAHAKGIDQGWLKGTGTFGDTVLADHKAVSEALSSRRVSGAASRASTLSQVRRRRRNGEARKGTSGLRSRTSSASPSAAVCVDSKVSASTR